MRLEEALKLKQGTIVAPNMSWYSPGKFTKGKSYALQGDAFPHEAKVGRRFEVVNAHLPLVDDSGKECEPVYIDFYVVS